jgi:hypothetical protein
MSNNSNNSQTQSSRGASRGTSRGGSRGASRGRGGRGGRGRGGRRRNNYKKVVKPIVKYDGPKVGTEAYTKLHKNNMIHKSRDEDTIERKFIPYAFKQDKSSDKYFQFLQQKMMDFGWRMKEDDGTQQFIHPTYQGESYPVYTRKLSSGSSICLPIMSKENDPKGLGCSIIYNYSTGDCKVETNEWQSCWNTRKGSRQQAYYKYLDARRNKRDQYIEMAKIDKSVIVWEKDTPRCNPETWRDDRLSMTDEY